MERDIETREMTLDERKILAKSIDEIMQNMIGKTCATFILESKDPYISGNTFLEDVIQDVRINSAWEEDGYYSHDDIICAIVRTLIARMNVEI